MLNLRVELVDCVGRRYLYCIFAVSSLCFTGKGRYQLENGKLMYGELQVVRKCDVTAKIEDAVKETKGGGSRKLQHHIREHCSSISEHRIKQHLDDSRAYSLLQTPFTNRPVMKHVSARDVQVRHQIDLIDMHRVRCIITVLCLDTY